jgi:hypothetical protein
MKLTEFSICLVGAFQCMTRAFHTCAPQARRLTREENRCVISYTLKNVHLFPTMERSMPQHLPLFPNVEGPSLRKQRNFQYKRIVSDCQDTLTSPVTNNQPPHKQAAFSTCWNCCYHTNRPPPFSLCLVISLSSSNTLAQPDE